MNQGWQLTVALALTCVQHASASTCLSSEQEVRKAAALLQHLQVRSMTSNTDAKAEEPQTALPPLCKVNEKLPALIPRHDMSFVDYQPGQDMKPDLRPGFSSSGLFVFPPNKFAFCVIEKNACSTWIENVLQPLLHQALYEERSAASSALAEEGMAWGVDYEVDRKSQLKYGIEGIESVFHDPTATRAVFVRDPLERFASAFMNKCFDETERKKGTCPSLSYSVRGAVEWAQRSNMAAVNGHWMPQANHCELYKRINSYNVIGLLSPETSEDDMNCVLRRAGLDRFIEPHQRRVNVRSSKMSKTELMKKLFTPAAAHAVIRALQIDYDTFRFTVPAWIAEATGEWYDMDPTPVDLHYSYVQVESGAEKGTQPNASKPHQQQGSANDQDDLLQLALQVGYHVS